MNSPPINNEKDLPFTESTSQAVLAKEGPMTARYPLLPSSDRLPHFGIFTEYFQLLPMDPSGGYDR